VNSLRSATRVARRLALRALPFAALAATTAAAVPRTAPAQTLEGRVVRADAGVPGASVQLHRVTRETAGVVAEGVSGPGGAFRMPLPEADTAGFTVFFATALADGVRYFGRPVHPNEPIGDYEVVVYDTTSAEAAVDSLRVSRRDVFLIPGPRGGWEVAEVVRVTNASGRTLVARGGIPIFGMEVPDGIVDFEAGETGPTGASANVGGEMVLMGSRVLATVPITPGERDFFFRYLIPPGTRSLALPVDRATDTLMMYVRQPGPEVEVKGMSGGGLIEAEGERFLRFRATDLAPAAPVSLTWRSPTQSPVDPRLVAGVLVGVILLGGAVVGMRRRA
jgi:hypothetical protein